MVLSLFLYFETNNLSFSFSPCRDKQSYSTILGWYREYEPQHGPRSQFAQVADSTSRRSSLYTHKAASRDAPLPGEFLERAEHGMQRCTRIRIYVARPPRGIIDEVNGVATMWLNASAIMRLTSACATGGGGGGGRKIKRNVRKTRYATSCIYISQNRCKSLRKWRINVHIVRCACAVYYLVSFVVWYVYLIIHELWKSSKFEVDYIVCTI